MVAREESDGVIAMYDYIRRTKILSGDLFSRLLKSRDIEDENKFLHPKIEQLNDPFLFDNMRIVCERVRSAVQTGQKITVYSDYDADGTCGAAILMGVLRELGANADNYIPDRFSEGYGTNPLAIQRIADSGTKLIITVDCGIKSVEDVELARENDVDVIILDHHECEDLPATPYIINPKVPGESYPYKCLCGAGIAFQFARAIIPDKAYKFADIAAVATIGDIVELTLDNRIIASVGLEKFRKQPNPGLAMLAKSASIDMSKISTYNISFGIVPRINSAGRMENARIAYDLLSIDDEAKLSNLADKLCALNDVRREAQARIIDECTVKVKSECNMLRTAFITVAGENWEKGVVGLAAQAISDKFYRPTLVLSESDGMLTGSARSIEGVNVYNVLKHAEHLFHKFGGHAQAAGLSFKSEHLAEVRSILNDAMEQMYGQHIFRRKLFYDEVLEVEEATRELARKIEQMNPFGMGNPEPVFLLPDVQINSATHIGKGDHVKFDIASGGAHLQGIRFSCKHLPIQNKTTDLAGRLTLNEFRGKSDAQFVALDYRQGLPVCDITLNFIKEISALCDLIETPTAYCISKDEREFNDLLHERMSASPLGTLLIAGSESGIASLDIEGLEECTFSPGYSVDIPAYSADNTICLTSAPTSGLDNYTSVLLCGSFVHAGRAELTLLSKELYNSLRREAAGYALSDAELGKILKAVSHCEVGFLSFGAAGKHFAALCNAPYKKVMCALFILCEEKLLNLKKRDRIYFNPTEVGGQPGRTRRALATLLPKMS